MVDFLIVRNKCLKADGTEDPATRYTHWYGEGPFTYKDTTYNSLKDFLEKKGHSVTDLSDADASPEKVEEWLKYGNMKTTKAAILFDHGSTSAFFGEKNNLAAQVINKANAEELTKGLQIYTFACLTNVANGLGQTAVRKCCYSWLGYTKIVYAMLYEPFKECIWSYIEAMADGKTMEECEAALRERYQAHDEESWVFGHNLDCLLLRKSQDNMMINSHNREGAPPKHPCPIAMATFGSMLVPHVQFLREFRDEIVLKSMFKTLFERLLDRYYQLSPTIARKMEEIPLFRRFVKYSIVYPFVMCTKAVAFIALAIRAL